MDKRVFYMVHDQARQNAIQAVQSAPAGYRVEVKQPSRSLDQNAAMWPILQAFADQLLWPVNGAMVHLSPDDWKDLLTAAFRQDMARVAQGINGGMVLLGARTSKFSRQEFSDFLEFLHSVAADRGVVVYTDEVAA